MPKKANEEKNNLTIKNNISLKSTKKNLKNVNTTLKIADTISLNPKTNTKKSVLKNSRKISKSVNKNSIQSTEKNKKTKKIGTISGESFSISEYYDLPYRYNQTIVKLLYQTPTTLFIYWDISNEDRENLKRTYGEDFFEKTKPVLIVFNETKGYSFEVEINDFANCWYLNVNDSKCKYKIELGRKPFEVIYNGEVTEVKTTPKITQNYIPITSSNEIESPNDHVLFEKNQEMIYFKNIKNNNITSKNIATLNFVKNIGKVYKINNFYKKFIKMKI